MSTYLHTMPVIIYNLGVEMIYVLLSRLKAQSIPGDKSIKVIHDVTLALFDRKFINEIYKPQEVAKHTAVRQLFEKLAHSSIMRLNNTSMNKLFDLMLMSLKMQILRTKFPEEIYQLTMNHLNSLLDILISQDSKGNQDVIDLVKESIGDFNKTYLSFTPYEYVILRQTLLRFIQGKNVKVSIFIQDNLQSQTGVIFLPMDEASPPAVKQPGLVVKYKTNGKVDEEYKLNLHLSTKYIANPCPDRLNVVTTELGRNMYMSTKQSSSSNNVIDLTQDYSSIVQPKDIDKDRNRDNDNDRNRHRVNEKDISIAKSIQEELLQYYTEEEKKSNDTKISSTSITKSNQEINEQRKADVEFVKKDFNQLADLLNVRSTDSHTFNFDIFKSKAKDKTNTINTYTDDEIIQIEREGLDTNKFKSIFEGITLEDNQEDDLLTLMDMASKR